MRQSQLFTKTRKEAPKDEVARNAQLLIRAGYIHKEMAGVYSLLPLGLRVMKKIEEVIREEMNAVGGQEVHLTSLQDPEIWKKTSRWDDDKVDIWFKTALKNGNEIGLANTHEEPLARLLSHHVSSYKDLPKYVYQFQTKFRNELRAKSGIMRGREFLMKDLYSFSRSEEEFREFYELCAEAYMRIFARVGLGDRTYRTFASGGSFSKFSDEFQTLTEVGEDTIYISDKKGIAINKEVYTDDVLKDLGLDKKELREEKAIEVGNIFPLGTKYAEGMGLMYRDEREEKHPAVMGSYGIGLGRLMGTVAEIFADGAGLIWPRSVAPFTVHLVVLSSEAGKGVRTMAEKLYMHMLSEGIEILYDDRHLSPGEKFADSDLIGIPLRVVVSEKTLAAGKFEVTERQNKESRMMTQAQLMTLL